MNNQQTYDYVKRLPEKPALEIVSFLINNFKSIHKVTDIIGFPESFKDVSYLKEAKDELALNISLYDGYHMLIFNVKLCHFGKFELVFAKNQLVQASLQLIFDTSHFQSFLDVFNNCKSIMEHDFLIDNSAWDGTQKQLQLVPSKELFLYFFGFYDIPPDVPEDIANFARNTFNLSEAEQKKEIFAFLMRKLANGKKLAIQDLHIPNTIEGYMSLVSPPDSQTSSLNVRIVEMEWCNAVYR